MKETRTCVFACVALSASALLAGTPAVELLQASQDPATRIVTVSYRLSDEPGIVTLGAETNRGDGVWVSIGDGNIRNVSGDANRVVGMGDHVLTWSPDKSWPNQRVLGGNFRVGVRAWATNAPPDYMLVDLSVPNSVRYFTCAAALPDGGLANDIYRTERLVMRKIPAANVTWRMGSPAGEPGRTAAREKPHLVSLSADYYIGVYPVTQKQYGNVYLNTKASYDKANPSAFPDAANADICPVEKVSWEMLRGDSATYDWPNDRTHAVDADRFLGKLRGFVGLAFDLPTEAQWEFACRAGTATPYNVTTNAEVLVGDVAWYQKNEGKVTHPVGTRIANAWGLYDMHGNVWEWCLDRYADGSYDGLGELTVDPPGSATSEDQRRSVRGGFWNSAASDCRSAFRRSYTAGTGYNSNGFRLCCPAVAR